ncbi:hypothetical protein ACFOZ1_12915 [Gracilibacillus marinus]|uniref:Uncharacterized protein n=1 Tax=Gracilibacillus marinus TaxID=630535 RepID=A0ABV8VW41_9BACI
MDELYQQLMIEQEKKYKLKRYLEQETQLKEQLEEMRAQERKWYHHLQEEKIDVEKLESFHIANLFYQVLGKKEEKLSKEKEEVIRSTLRYEEAQASVKDMEEELKELTEKMKELGDPENRYKELLHSKYERIVQLDNEEGKKATQLLEQLGELQAEEKEINEAIDAGYKVNACLQSASASLDKAKNWGTVDMVGGGLISTSIKHSHIDDAKKSTHEAQRLLRKFSNELSDIGQSFDNQIEISGSLTFADYFLDGLVMDWFVQDKINHSLNEVEEMKRKVANTISELKDLKQDIASLGDATKEKWETIILHA